jgi:predicted ATPase/transcriptional regulator with XRE-family HTH domain
MRTAGRGDFAALLRQRRLEAGLTQQELAERSGLSVRAVSDLERAINLHPRRDSAAMLADGLGLTGPARESFLDAARSRGRASPEVRFGLGESTLPRSAGPLFGRDRELRAIAGALGSEHVRLLTLTGPGGVGKTRLAIEAAGQVAARFADGVRFVRLDGLKDPTLVLPTVASRLELLETGGKVPLAARLARHLAQQELLIVVDNLEHLLPAASDLADLLDAASRSKLLVTSRESLRVRGERVFPVAPLPRPDPTIWHGPTDMVDVAHAPAIGLFLHRASATISATGDSAVPEQRRDDLEMVARICQRLDGLPLAIELAAAQTEVLTPAAILALLESSALPLLAGGGRDEPERLRTMDAAIGWSYDLLPAAEQPLFRALSVFAAGFDLSAAASVMEPAGPTRDRFEARDLLARHDPALVGTMTSLARRNLIVEEVAEPHPIAPRFRMLEPIRLFALDRLRHAGEENAIRRRHAEYFTQLAEVLDPLTLGPAPEIWLRQQVLDLDNFRAASDWALAAGEHDLVVRLTCSIAQLWELRGLLSEARQRINQAIAVEAAATPANRWFLRFWAGTFALDWGDAEEAIRYGKDLLEIAEAHGESVGIGAGLALLSRAIGARPDAHAEAAALARRAVDALEPLGLDEWTGWAWSRLGIERHRLGQLAEARADLTRSLEIRRRKGCEGCVAYSLVGLGAVLADLGEPHDAASAFRESLELAVRHENYSLMLSALFGLVDVARRFAEGGDERTVLALFGGAEALRRRHGLAQAKTACEAIARWLAEVRGDRDELALEAAIQDGLEMTVDDLLDTARSLPTADISRRVHVSRNESSLLRALGSAE